MWENSLLQQRFDVAPRVILAQHITSNFHLHLILNNAQSIRLGFTIRYCSYSELNRRFLAQPVIGYLPTYGIMLPWYGNAFRIAELCVGSGIHHFLVCLSFSTSYQTFQLNYIWRDLLDRLWSDQCYRHSITRVIENVFHDPQRNIHDSKVHGANMGPTWVLSVPDGTRVGPMNFAMRDVMISA